MAISLKKAENIIAYAPKQDCIVLVSPPGTGKSSAAVRAAHRMGALYWPIYAATYEAVDARGLPYIEEASERKAVKWASPNCLPLQADSKQYGGKTVVVNLDDLFQAPPPVQRAFVRCIYGDGVERKIGDFLLYDGIRFMATGNRESDRAGVYRPETYVNDRLTYLEIEPDVDDFVSGAIGGFAKPDAEEGYNETRRRIDAAVGLGISDELIAYVKWSKQCYDFSTEQRSFLSPRSIERLGRFIRALDAAGIDGDCLAEVASGTIGEAHAIKFMAFHRLRDQLPDVDAILRGEDVPLPVKSEILFILCTTLLRAAKKDNLSAMVKYIHRLADLKGKDGMQVGVEVSVYMARECIHGAGTQLRGIVNDRAFMEWISKNGKFLMQ